MNERLPPTRGKNRVFRVFDFLRGAKTGGQTDLETSLKTFVAQNKRRGLAILISDLYDPAGFEAGINVLRYNKFEPYVLQVFDPNEFEPQLGGDVRLVDQETGSFRDVTVTERVLKRYAEAHRSYRESIATFCQKKQVPYFALRTDEKFDDAILRVLRRGGMIG